MAKALELELTERMRAILFAVVAEHIETAQPVASRSTASRSGLGLSPASVRALMGQLTERGLLAQPHVSAGRLPTSQAYRLYVDALLEGLAAGRLGNGPTYELGEPVSGLDEFMRRAADLLSEATGQVGFYLGRPAEEVVLEGIHFTRVSSERVMALLVSHGRVIQTRVLTESDSDTRMLERVSARLSELACGCTLAEARSRLAASIEMDRALSDELRKKVLVLGWESLARANEAELYVSDRNRLLAHPEFENVARLRDVLAALEEKERMMNLLDKVLTSGTSVAIGDELGDPAVRECALVTASLGHAAGGLGVIGPVRMPYERVIPAVRSLSERVSDTLC
jgi:heat-inducible transcriptional repressor